MVFALSGRPAGALSVPGRWRLLLSQAKNLASEAAERPHSSRKLAKYDFAARRRYSCRKKIDRASTKRADQTENRQVHAQGNHGSGIETMLPVTM